MRTSIPEVGTEQGEPQPTQGEKRGSKSLECVTFVVSRSPRHMYTHDCGKNPFLGGGGGHYCLQNKHFSGGKADVASASSELLWRGGPIFHARNDEKGSTFCQMMLANTLLNPYLGGSRALDWGYSF